MSKTAQRDQVLGHGDEADGIEEYDNPLPDWWLGLFWITIIFAFGYTIDYHLVAHRSPQKELAAEVAAAKARWPEGGAGAAFVPTPELAARGKLVFQTNCVPCHGADMKGGIGPNLLDTLWIHGGAPEQILATITNGVPDKGMLTWGPILGPEKVAEVTAYVVDQNRAATGQK